MGGAAALAVPMHRTELLWRGITERHNMVALKTITFTILVPGSATALIPYLLLSGRSARSSFDAGLFGYFGALPILLGASIYLWCAYDFTFAGKGTPAPIDPPLKLVVRGLYRFVGNPMYVGILLVLLGEALLFGSPLLLGYAALLLLIFHLFVVLYEEPALKRKFGEAYHRYGDSVPRWLPNAKMLSKR